MSLGEIVGKSIIKVGDIFYPLEGGSCKVVEYRGANNITVEFDCYRKYRGVFQSSHLRRGRVSNPYHPRTLGVGYKGVGYFNSKNSKKAYEMWVGVITRGNCLKYKTKKPTYKDCTVHPDWHNFQNFAKWYTEHESSGLGYEIDKDILVKGNKVYGEEFCLLIPRIINSTVKTNYKKCTGLPLGVTQQKGGGFVSRFNSNKNNSHLGTFDTPEEASTAYVLAKEAYVKEIAELWKGKIEDKAYESLMAWAV